MDNTNLKTDVMFETITILFRYSIYWFTAEAISWDLDVSEERVAEELDMLVEWGLVERLDFSIVWYKITQAGIAKVIEYRLNH